ncbi:MAG: glycosyltransferase family 2 protein [Alphaproteobacteria bacterium GM202ARS2]|nr:glycosyltransferase family 2 protein [Alphaproteobacteria bacterium GM202ARS2]
MIQKNTLPTAKKGTPKISVTTATYNRAHLLPVAIDSILKQTLTDWELIIVDDASTDNTPEVARRFTQQDPRIRYHRHQRNSGIATARNTSIKLAQGTYIALQDDDDISLPQRLQKQAEFLDENPHIHLVSSWLQYFTKNKRRNKRRNKRQNRRQNRRMCQTFKADWSSQPCSLRQPYPPYKMPLPGGCIMGHKYVFDSLPMRPFFRLAEDYDFILRCIDTYAISHIPEILYLCRLADAKHKTLSTDSSTTFNMWCYHLAAWISAYSRSLSRHDPVEQHTDVSTLLRDTAPLFQNIPREPQKHLLRNLGRRCLHHALRHRDAHSFQETLDVLSILSSKEHMLAITPKVLFACLRRGCVGFISPFITTLLTEKPS